MSEFIHNPADAGEASAEVEREAKERKEHNGKVLQVMINHMLETMLSNIINKGHIASVAYTFQLYLTHYLFASNVEEEHKMLDSIGEMASSVSVYVRPEELETISRSIESIKKDETVDMPSFQSNMLPLMSGIRSYASTVMNWPALDLPSKL